MPSPLTTTLLAFGAVLTSFNAIAGASVALVAVVWEFAVTLFAGGAQDGLGT